MRDLAKSIYEMLADSDDGKPLTSQKIDQIISELSEKLYKEYPYYKNAPKNKAKKVIVKTREELQAEAQTVRDIMGTAGPYMPERAGIRYHVVSMDWFNKWKAYVEYDK